LPATKYETEASHGVANCNN